MRHIDHEPDLPPYRPPSEAHSALVRVTRGCTWNRCAFCGMYKDVRFELREVEEIAADLEVLGKFWHEARSVFLGDSDSLVHPQLPDVVRMVREAFPHAERVTSYSRLSTLRSRPLDWQRELRAAGLTRIHAGLESGSGDVLSGMKKGATPEQAIRGACRALEAGFNLCLYVLSGLGGEDQWREHARGTAAVVNRVRPHFLRLRSLVLLPEAPLHRLWREGKFRPITPLSRLRETRLLVESLTYNSDGHRGDPCGPPDRAETQDRRTRIVSDHFSNYVWSAGRLVYRGIEGEVPRDADRMIGEIEEAMNVVLTNDQAEDIGTHALEGRIPRL